MITFPPWMFHGHDRCQPEGFIAYDCHRGASSLCDEDDAERVANAAYQSRIR